MNYLTVQDLYSDNEIEYKKERLLLIEPDGEAMTFINETDESIEQNNRIDLSARVFIKQRWKVEIQPPDNFSKKFVTHRYISVYLCTYSQLLKEQERVYTARDVLPHKEIDSNVLGDNFGNSY